MPHPYLTDSQVTTLTTMVNERFKADDDAGREPFRAQFRAVRDREATNKLFIDLRAVPTLAHTARVEAAARLNADRITEEGFYRNPETGELYRVTKSASTNWELRVQKYSKTGGLRRVSTEGNLVKGSWKRFGGFDSRRLLRTIKKDWLLTEDQLTEFAYGFCPYHGGPLTDGVSVALGYGKVCADKEGKPWSEEAAEAVLAAQRAAQASA